MLLLTSTRSGVAGPKTNRQLGGLFVSIKGYMCIVSKGK